MDSKSYGKDEWETIAAIDRFPEIEDEKTHVKTKTYKGLKLLKNGEGKLFLSVSDSGTKQKVVLAPSKAELVLFAMECLKAAGF